MLYRLILIIIVVVSVAGVVAGIRIVQNQAKTQPPPPPAAEPARSPYARSLAATGIIEAARENVAVATTKPGVAIKVFVSVGASVKAGDPLFQIDDRETRARVESLDSQIDVQKASLLAEQVTLADARDQWERMEKLQREKVASTDEALRKRFLVENWEARCRKLEADIKAAEAQVREAKIDLDILTVHASRDGDILQLNLREGEYANINPPQPLMVLGDVKTLQIRADVDEQNAPLVPHDRAATAFVKGSTKDPLPLKFVRIEPFVIPKKSLTGDSTERVDTRVLEVIFALDRPTNRPLYVGMQVDVFIDISTPAQAEKR